MENEAATLYCPNENCQALNPLTHNFCQQCRTPLPKRYLWAVGDALVASNTGEILADRYLVISKSILFDTKPGSLPQRPELENLDLIKPYLRLIPHRLHIPQVYGVLILTKGGSRQEVLLLEKPPLNTDGEDQEVRLCSQLTTDWGSASSMRQLNWLWQIAQLWQPLATVGVVSSLLDKDLLRVEGSLVRLLELRTDEKHSPELPQLGEFWQQLLPTTKPSIAEFVKVICSSLEQGKIHSDEQLIAILDQGLAEIGRLQTPTIKIAAKSDTGPSRQRNEDACYPPSGSTITKPPQSIALAIVCDGIGGHEGGNVASNLAIETIQQQVKHLSTIPSEHIHPVTVLDDLEQAAAVANDKISQINDNENRQGRQRMGTTLVMAVPIAHEMYVAHVGDSRAYWITRHGCYQVTLDDDVASREVRLGYAIYRDAVQQGASGSLVQALGMSSSSSLHPTAQRFIVDEDCIFLLCSDGLSDFDRVEQYWDTEILPILTEKLDVESVTEKLVEIANNKNGHDNVTIALVHYQVSPSEPESNLSAALVENSAASFSADSSPKTTSTHRSSNQTTKVISTPKQAKSLTVPLKLVVLIVTVLGGLLLGYSLHRLFGLKLSLPGYSPLITPQPPVATSENPSRVSQGQLIETKSATRLSKITQPPNEAIAPPGSILQILSTEPIAKSINHDSWIHMRICSIGGKTPTTSHKSLLNPGDEVKILQSKFQLSKLSRLSGDNASQCQSQKPVPQSTPKPVVQKSGSVSKSNTDETGSSRDQK